MDRKPLKWVPYFTTQFVQFALVIGVFVILARGGFQPIPISIVNAGDLTDTKNAALVLKYSFYNFKDT